MKIVICFISFFIVTCVSASVMEDRLRRSKTGDYVVVEANKMTSLLVIRSMALHTLILEEITIPSNILQPRPTSWGEWIKKKAPGHTSWSMIEIDLDTHQPLECYSFSRSSWVQLTAQDSLIATLMDLPLTLVPLSEQRRIGPSPQNDEPDRRKIWQPPLIINGEQLQDAEFDIYAARWPSDGSVFAENTVSIYFDRSARSPFPVWIQVATAHVTASLRIIDSGKGLPVVHKTLPRRVPEFIGMHQKTPRGLRLSLKSPKYYRSFELYAVDVTTRERQIYPMTHSLVNGEGEILQIEIDQGELQSILQSDHRYTWLIVPTGQSQFYSESPKSFLWK